MKIDSQVTGINFLHRDENSAIPSSVLFTKFFSVTVSDVL